MDALLGAYVLGLAPALLGGTRSDRYGRRAGRAPRHWRVRVSGASSLAMDRLAFLFTGRLLCGVAWGWA